MAQKYEKPSELTAIQAKMEAQKIAFSAISFEAVVCLLRLGALRQISESGQQGISSNDLAERLDVGKPGIKVLLDMALTMRLVWQNEDRFVLDKIGHFLLEDEMSQINVNFAQDVCYEPMGRLMESIQKGTPEGLRVFGDWPTIYSGLSQLPEPAKSSWFAFNDYYSRKAFPHALPIVFESRPDHILDVGGHLGEWALQCFNYDEDVHVTIADLPDQAAMASVLIEKNQAEGRVDTIAMDLLDPQQALPDSMGTIWMSQFLDCFSETQIHTILDKAASAMGSDDSLYVLELFWDCQEYDVGAYSINATSLYFTCIANGVSRMYHSKDIIAIARRAGFRVQAQHDGLGVGHTLLHFKKA